MASTFSVFRKNQRTLMAVFGVLLMIAFTLSGVLPELASGGGSPQNPVIATSRYGTIQASDLAQAIDQRRIVQSFLFQAMVTGRVEQQKEFLTQQLKGEPEKMFGPNWTRILQQNVAQEVEREVMNQIGPVSERGVVETKVLAEEARQQGITITDDAIDAFIKSRTFDHVTNDQLKNILASLSTRDSKARVSKAQLYDALRVELAAMKLRDQFFASFRTTPAERWDYYSRMKRSATAEVAAIPVADFIAEVREPSDVELRKFYDAHKSAEPVPGSSEPGFKVPHKAGFEYFMAPYEKFVDEAAITEDEIAEHYEKNKQKYPYSPLGDDEPADEKKDADKKEDNKKEDTEKKPVEDKKPEADKKPNEADKPAEKAAKPDDKPAEVKKPADTKADDEQPNDASCAADDDKPAKTDAAEEKKPAAEVPAKTEAPKADAPKIDAAPKTEATPKAEAPKTESPKTDPIPPEVKNAPPGSITPPVSAPRVPVSTAPRLQDRYTLPSDITAGASPQYEPLWKVKDQIRKELAQQRAVTKMTQVLTGLQNEMRLYAKRRTEIEARNKRDPNHTEPLPPRLDFATMAEKAGVVTDRIPLASAYEISQSAGLGKSTIGSEPFTVGAFRSLKTYMSAIATDNDGNRYLFWKTQEVEAHVPQLADVRSEIVRAWKLIQAREPALKKAKELAKLASESKKNSLKDALGDDTKYKVVATGPFKWLETGSAGSFSEQDRPRLGEVDGVEDVGEAFMRAAFALHVGDIGTAFNEPQTVVSIIRLTTLEPSETLLRDSFLADRARGFQMAAFKDEQQLYNLWHDDFVRQTKLVWATPPADEENR